MSSVSPGSPETPEAIAFVRESECIGCAKCLPVCPVDAILGAPGMMHTVISAECTGCELCLEPCPTDCIEMRAIPQHSAIPDEDLLRHRRRREEYHDFRLTNPDPRLWPKTGRGGFSREEARREIAAAVARVAARRKGP